MTIPQSLIQASIGVGLSSLEREQAERFRRELEDYRQELFNQIDTPEFRAKNQND